MKNIFQLLALITIWASTAAGAILTATPQVYVAAVFGTGILAVLIGAVEFKE